ncbi:hypothetical protein BJX76DRAFT_361841 [Aspergillus varians]
MYVLPVSITFVCVATIVVALRLFTRIRLVSAPGWDDWFLLLALLTDYAFFGVLVAEHHYGLGSPEASASPDKYRNLLKMLWISIPLYNLTLNLTKISMLLLYKRLFPPKKYQIALTALLVLVVCTGLYMFFGTLLLCIPVHAFWEPDRVEHTCVSREVVWYLNAALQITGDLIVVILPMPQLLKLHIPFRQKMCLMVIFALGLFVCATSVARLYALVKFLKSRDSSRYSGWAATWSFVEANVAIICASLPTFRQLIHSTFSRILPSSARRAHSRNSEKQLQGPALWGPFQGPARYSADVSVSADRESASHHGEGIQVVRELKWEMGSVTSGSEHAVPGNKTERGDSDGISAIQFE